MSIKVSTKTLLNIISTYELRLFVYITSVKFEWHAVDTICVTQDASYFVQYLASDC